eukprot:1264681-Rhodomonas_salina.4
MSSRIPSRSAYVPTRYAEYWHSVGLHARCTGSSTDSAYRGTVGWLFRFDFVLRCPICPICGTDRAFGGPVGRLYRLGFALTARVLVLQDGFLDLTLIQRAAPNDNFWVPLPASVLRLR